MAAIINAAVIKSESLFVRMRVRILDKGTDSELKMSRRGFSQKHHEETFATGTAVHLKRSGTKAGVVFVSLTLQPGILRWRREESPIDDQGFFLLLVNRGALLFVKRAC